MWWELHGTRMVGRDFLWSKSHKSHFYKEKPLATFCRKIIQFWACMISEEDCFVFRLASCNVASPPGLACPIDWKSVFEAVGT